MKRIYQDFMFSLLRLAILGVVILIGMRWFYSKAGYLDNRQAIQEAKDLYQLQKIYYDKRIKEKLVWPWDEYGDAK